MKLFSLPTPKQSSSDFTTTKQKRNVNDDGGKMCVHRETSLRKSIYPVSFHHAEWRRGSCRATFWPGAVFWRNVERLISPPRVFCFIRCLLSCLHCCVSVFAVARCPCGGWWCPCHHGCSSSWRIKCRDERASACALVRICCLC